MGRSWYGISYWSFLGILITWRFELPNLKLVFCSFVRASCGNRQRFTLARTWPKGTKVERLQNLLLGIFLFGVYPAWFSAAVVLAFLASSGFKNTKYRISSVAGSGFHEYRKAHLWRRSVDINIMMSWRPVCGGYMCSVQVVTDADYAPPICPHARASWHSINKRFNYPCQNLT